jgi:hypothetical protein
MIPEQRQRGALASVLDYFEEHEEELDWLNAELASRAHR